MDFVIFFPFVKVFFFVMQQLVVASNFSCSAFVSLSNPFLGTLASVTPGYGI